MLELLPGLLLQVPIANEGTDHYWVVLTGPKDGDEVVFVMLTDARNVLNPNPVLPQGTQISQLLRLRKETTVNYARSRRAPRSQVASLIHNGSLETLGQCTQELLELLRSALFDSPDTPDDVYDLCLGLDW